MNSYLIFKALHLVSLISWMAGLLYLPRIFVYHAENNDNENITNIFKIMEKKLYFYIMYPAMLLTWAFGLLLLHLNHELLLLTWMKIKLILVIVLTIYHFQLGSFLKDFKKNECKKSSKFFRFFNEIPTLLLILIVFLTILKPIWG